MGWWVGRGENASIMYTSLHGQQEIYWYFEKQIIWATRSWLISTVLHIVFELDRQKVKNLKEKETRLFWEKLKVLDCNSLHLFQAYSAHISLQRPQEHKAWNRLQFTAFFSNFHVLKTWFEFLRIKLYRNNLKGNKNYFELAGGSSYWGQNYSKWKKEIQGKSILVQVSEGLSHWELTVHVNSLISWLRAHQRKEVDVLPLLLF